MSNLDQTHANNILDASLGTAAFVATVTPLRMRIMTTNGTASTNGTELASGGDYTAGTGAPAATFSSASPDAASTVTINSMPAVTSPAMNGVELWDSAGTPKRKWWGAFSGPKTSNAGDALTVSMTAGQSA